ncbi:hypothetical protein [Alkalihalophilus marmarensis]|nr:hypothetical protein [Alkalihalophilus marmarensis]MEC2073780.1 hypothetical protein [Alkalihalophilus marmarensis]
MEPLVICPKCHNKKEIRHLLTAQSNQNIIYECPDCAFILRNIETKKG